MHIKSEKAKKTTKYTLYLTQELTENTQRPINKAQKVMTFRWQIYDKSSEIHDIILLIINTILSTCHFF